MRKKWQMSLSTLVVGAAAFFAGPVLWPMAHNAPMPPPSLLPGYVAVSAVEALAFGFAVSFAAFGWPATRAVRFGAPWLKRMLFASLVWLTGNWWIHDSLHMHIGLDMNRLLYIEASFHITLLACGLALALGVMQLARAPVAGNPN
jgi:hypothetical protein